MNVRLCPVRFLILTGMWLGVSSSSAQPTPKPLDAAASRFVADARAGTRRYQSKQEAINDGFTRVGVEFPAMGEHWVSFARLLEDKFDAARPSVLIYVNRDSASTLAGVAYTTLLSGSKHPPAFPFPNAWHEHSGAVNEESLPLGHQGHGASMPTLPADADSPRLFILHAWIWSANPQGLFVTDNWSLPLARLGLAPADSAPADAIRAIALAADDDEYNRLVIRTTLKLSAAEDVIVGKVLDSHRSQAEREVETIRRTRLVTPGEISRLSAIWNSLWAKLEQTLPARAASLGQLRSQM